MRQRSARTPENSSLGYLLESTGPFFVDHFVYESYLSLGKEKVGWFRGGRAEQDWFADIRVLVGRVRRRTSLHSQCPFGTVIAFLPEDWDFGGLPPKSPFSVTIYDRRFHGHAGQGAGMKDRKLQSLSNRVADFSQEGVSPRTIWHRRG